MVEEVVQLASGCEPPCPLVRRSIEPTQLINSINSRISNALSPTSIGEKGPLEIAHTDLNKAKQARNQYYAARTYLKEVDGKWIQFNKSLQLAYNLDHADKREKRGRGRGDEWDRIFVGGSWGVPFP